MNDTEFRRRYGPWALVTGSAMGIGAAYVDALAARGLDLVLVDRDSGGLAEQSARLRERHPRIEIRALVADLADRARVDAALDAVADLEIGLLVANAAHAATAPWLAIPLEDKLLQIQVNCVAVTVMVDRLSRQMAERRRGGIIVMSSFAGQIGSPRVATYAATKAFDRILGESLWAELPPHGVDVLAVLPGSTRTPGFEGSLTPRSKLPSGMRVMEPEDVVREALAALGSRPSVVAGRSNRAAAAVMQRLLPRKLAVAFMARSTRSLYPDAPSR